MNVVYLGSGDIGLPTLEWLLASPEVRVVGVVTQPDRPAGRGLQVKPCAVKELAIRHGFVPLQPAKVRGMEAVAQLAALEADLFVVMAYGQILPQEVLDLPRLGAINLHASLLPRHRGAAPVHAAVLAGDRISGITVMWMDAGLDTGDILLREECELQPDETAGSLRNSPPKLWPGPSVSSLGATPRVSARRRARLPTHRNSTARRVVFVGGRARRTWTAGFADFIRGPDAPRSPNWRMAKASTSRCTAPQCVREQRRPGIWPAACALVAAAEDCSNCARCNRPEEKK
jgi:hypothetical protein